MSASENDCFTQRRKSRCEQISKIGCISNPCGAILLEKGQAERLVGQKVRRKALKDGSCHLFGSDGELPLRHIAFPSKALKKHYCIPGNAIPLPIDCECHILVRAGPNAA